MKEDNPKTANDKVSINFRFEGKDAFTKVYSFIACGENNKEFGILCFSVHLAERLSIIEAFRVEEPHRNKGIGTLLLKAYANLLESYPSEICFSTRNNQKVIHLFRKFGFSIVPHSHLDFIKMVKNQSAVNLELLN